MAPDSSQPGVRTDEEREQARAERARRRAAALGHPPAAAGPMHPLEVLGSPHPSEVAGPMHPLEMVGSPHPSEVAGPMHQPEVAGPPLPPPTASPPAISSISPSPPPSLPPRERRRGHSLLTRALALLALVLVALAAWLALDRLTRSGHTAKPVAAPVVVRVLIPEGETRLQIAARAHTAGLSGDYLTAAKRSGLLNPASYGAPAGTPNLEGFLFPATYELYRGDPAARLVHEQLIAFTERFGDEDARRARELRLTPYQLLIVASMVEREAQLAGDRPKVAAVIYNRLRLRMPLGIDATLRYALNDYTQPLTAAQLALDSPYNTRTHLGLPPTPISNPGLAAIEAAAHPAHVGYLYYVAGADGCGEQVFSTTYAQFEHDAAAYRAALAANGGRVPTCRHPPR